MQFLLRISMQSTWAPHPLDVGKADPLERRPSLTAHSGSTRMRYINLLLLTYLLTYTCYPVDFVRSRSN